MTRCHFKRYTSQSRDQSHDFSCDCQFYRMIFSVICQFLQRPDFHVIFDGDDPSPPVADPKGGFPLFAETARSELAITR